MRQAAISLFIFAFAGVPSFMHAEAGAGGVDVYVRSYSCGAGADASASSSGARDSEVLPGCTPADGSFTVESGGDGRLIARFRSDDAATRTGEGSRLIAVPGNGRMTISFGQPGSSSIGYVRFTQSASGGDGSQTLVSYGGNIVNLDTSKARDDIELHVFRFDGSPSAVQASSIAPGAASAPDELGPTALERLAAAIARIMGL